MHTAVIPIPRGANRPWGARLLGSAGLSQAPARAPCRWHSLIVVSEQLKIYMLSLRLGVGGAGTQLCSPHPAVSSPSSAVHAAHPWEAPPSLSVLPVL